MVINPQGAMYGGANEETTTRPTMDVVELLIAVSGTEEKGENGVLRGEEEDDWELGQRHEAYTGSGQTVARKNTEPVLTSSIGILKEGRVHRYTCNDQSEIAGDDSH